MYTEMKLHEKGSWIFKRTLNGYINFKKKKMKLLTNEQQKSYQNVNICYICKEKFEDEYIKDKKYREVKDHFHDPGEHRGSVHSICNLMYRVPKNIPIVFHDGSNYIITL